MSQSNNPKQRASDSNKQKLIFKITHEENKIWIYEEYNKLIEGMKMYDKNWNKLCSYVTTKTYNEVVNCAQDILNKLTKFDQEPLEVIKKTPTSLLVNFIAGKDGSGNLLTGAKLNRVPRLIPGIIIPHVERREEIVVRKGKRKRPIIEEQVGIPQQVVNVEENKDKMCETLPIPPQVHKNALDIITQLKEEVHKVEKDLASEKAECKRYLDSDIQFKDFWESLEKCSTSLGKMLADIESFHKNIMPPQPLSVFQQPQKLKRQR